MGHTLLLQLYKVFTFKGNCAVVEYYTHHQFTMNKAIITIIAFIACSMMFMSIEAAPRGDGCEPHECKCHCGKDWCCCECGGAGGSLQQAPQFQRKKRNVNGASDLFLNNISVGEEAMRHLTGVTGYRWT